MMTSRHADAKQYISTFRDHLSSPPGAYLFQAHLRGGGGLIETGGLFERRVFNFETTMASVLHEELEYKMVKLKYKTF